MWFESSHKKSISYVHNLHDLHSVTNHRNKATLLFEIPEQYADTLEK